MQLLLNRSVRYALDRERYEAALDLARLAVNISRDSSDTECPQNLISGCNLAELYIRLGRYEEAEPLYQLVLANPERVLSRGRLDILYRIHNLAGVYFSQNRYQEAASLFELALIAAERLLGNEHPHTLSAMCLLGICYGSLERPAEAADLLVRALAGNERILGWENPETQITSHALANLYLGQQQYEKAMPLFQWLAATNERQLGLEHPDTLAAVHHLADSCMGLANYEEAARLFERALAARERVVSEDDAITLGSLTGLAVSYLKQNRYDQAEPALRRALGLSERLHGATHPETLGVMKMLGSLYSQQNRHAEAEPLYQQLLAVYDVAAKQDVATLIVITKLADAYVGQEHYDQAEPLYERAIALSERLRGQDDPATLTLMNNLAVVYTYQQQHDRAERLFKLVLAGRERLFGPEHPDTLGIIRSLASVYKAQENYGEAEPLYERYLTVNARVQPDEDPDMRESLGSLYLIYTQLRKWDNLEPLGKRLVAAHERALGTDHPITCGYRHSLARLYVNLGRLEEAIPLYEQQLAATEQQQGAEHPDTLACVNTLARLYGHQGRYADVESSFRRVFMTRIDALGPLHPDTLAAAHTLAEFYDEHEDYGGPLRQTLTVRKVLSLRERVLGGKHPDTLVTANQLAISYMRRRRDDKATALLEKLLPVREEVLGSDNPDTLSTAILLGVLYIRQGEYDKAQPLYERAVRADPETHELQLASLYVDQGQYENAEPLIDRALARKRLPGVGGHLLVTWVARLYAKMGRCSEAFVLLRQSHSGQTDLLLNRLNISSPGQAIMAIEQTTTDLAIFISLVWRNFRTSPEHVRIAADVVLRRKALGLEVAMSQSEALLSGRYPHLEHQIHELTVRRNEWTRKVLEGQREGESAEEYFKQLEQLGARVQKVETDLPRQIPELRLTERILLIDRAAVALALPERSRLIEFLRFDVFDFEAKLDYGWKPARYVAFVLSADDADSIEMVDLGPAEEIDGMIRTFRRLIGREAGIEDSRSPVESVPVQDIWNIAEQLRTAVVDPVLGTEQGQRVFLATDGELNLLPFEALPAKSRTTTRRYLVDEHHLSYLGTGRDLLRLQEKVAVSPGEAVVIADPAFELTQKLTSVGPAVRTDLARDLEREGVAFQPLPGTRVEGERLARRLKVAPWIGDAVLEKRVKQVHSPKILHAATHGYFLPDPKPVPAISELRFGVGNLVSDRLLHLGNIRDPMLRSGLALAGSQSWLEGNTLPEEAEDGLLTAEDASTMDLRGTQLVVLSACKTGVGEVLCGEGVFGLRRGFAIAGARTVVMSLWKVDDLATILLMDRFYENLLERNMGRDEALRDAQSYLRREVTIGKIRMEWLNEETIKTLSNGNQQTRARLETWKTSADQIRPFAEVYYWGAFILHGDTTPLGWHTEREL